MRLSSIAALLAGGLLFIPLAAHAQFDACQGTADKMSVIKEQITPQLSANDAVGLKRLTDIRSHLETFIGQCKNARQLAEFWSYYLIVVERLGPKGERPVPKGQHKRPNDRPSWQKDVDQARQKVAELGSGLDEVHNPFNNPPPAPEPKAIQRKWGLVVGIDRFLDPQAPALNYAVKDSSDFASFLTDKAGGRFVADRVHHLTNDSATLQGIKEQLGWLRKNAQNDDLVVVYFSSHGSPRSADPNGVSYIVAHDTSLESPEKLYATSLQMIDLVQMLTRDLKARRVVLILDTCFSGDAQTPTGAKGVWALSAPDRQADASTAFSPALNNLKIGYGRVVITASRADESSWESPKLQNGYFTRFLIDALNESHGNRPLNEIFPVVRQRVSLAVSADHAGVSQTPTAEFSEQGNTVAIGIPESQE